MRPLLFGSGKKRMTKRRTFGLISFNEAAAFRQRKTTRQALHARARFASMRPLLFGSGKRKKVAIIGAGHGASMRPLLFGSGKSRLNTRLRRLTTLQ